MANAQAIIDMEEYQKLKQSDITLNKIWEILSKNGFEKNVVTGDFDQTISQDNLCKIYFFGREWADKYLKKEDKNEKVY